MQGETHARVPSGTAEGMRRGTPARTSGTARGRTSGDRRDDPPEATGNDNAGRPGPSSGDDNAGSAGQASGDDNTGPPGPFGGGGPPGTFGGEGGEPDGLRLAELIRAGRLGAVEAVEAAIARIEASRDHLNAVPITCFERALEDARRPPPDPGSPLAGVPFLLKDLGPSCAGVEATAGSVFLAGYAPPRDATLVERFRAAGLLIVGKSATAEFGVLPTTESRRYGPTRNPRAPGRSAGGSSGGAAAAVAAGLVPVAHANDAGGSIRIPASCCGVFGLKPTRARTPLGPDTGDLMSGFAAEHVVSRSVRDSAAMLDLVAGPAEGDPYWAPPAPGSFRAAAASARPGRLRVAVTVRGGLTDPHPECVRAVRRAADLCADLGHEVVEAAPDVGIGDVAEPFLDVWAAGVSSAVTALGAAAGRRPEPHLLEELTWWLYERGRELSAAHYLLTIGRLQRAARSLAAFHARHDVLLGPVTSEPAPPLGAFDAGTPERRLRRALEFVHETPLANMTGQPAMSVPLHRDPAGVPVGVQFTARFGDEALLFALAAQLEAARPWA